MTNVINLDRRRRVIHWKPSATDMRAIREGAAKATCLPPTKIVMHPALRVAGEAEPSFNDLLFPAHTSDLYDNPWTFTDLKRMGGVKLTPSGKAAVDVFVYKRGFGDHGDLITKIWVDVAIVDGKARVVGIRT